MKKVIVFMDYANIDASARATRSEVDFAALLNYLASDEEGRTLQAAFAYVPIDPRQEHAQDATINQLWDDGFIVKEKIGTIAGTSYKCDFDVEMTMDITKAAYDIKPDIVVLISGDSDFIPVVMDLRKRGIRVEIASFGCAMSGMLERHCSGFINLDLLAAEETSPEYPDHDDYVEHPEEGSDIPFNMPFAHEEEEEDQTAVPNPETPGTPIPQPEEDASADEEPIVVEAEVLESDSQAN